MHKKTIALLTKPVMLPTEPPMTLPADTLIIVDTVAMVALFENDHFDIFRDEYSLLN